MLAYSCSGHMKYKYSQQAEEAGGQFQGHPENSPLAGSPQLALMWQWSLLLLAKVK